MHSLQNSKMLARIYLTAGLSLLSACGGAPALQAPHQSAVLGTYDAGILPGSKGDRSHLDSVELELNLPLETAFTLAQLTRQEAENWSIEVDGKRPARVRLSSARPGGDGQLLTFVLEDVSVLTHARVHELVIYSADGVLQTAGLMPLPANQTRAPEALNSQTLAEWLIARELLNGKPLQKLAPEVLVQLQTTPEAQTLTQDLKDLYRQSRGKADPRKSAKAEAAARAAAQKQAEKLSKRAAQAEKKADKQRANHVSHDWDDEDERDDD